jgi:vesicular inhibitory amino acid transporter
MFDSPSTTLIDQDYDALASPSLSFMSPRMERALNQFSGTPQRRVIRQRSSNAYPYGTGSTSTQYGSSTAPPIMNRLTGRTSDVSSLHHTELGSDFEYETVGTSTFLQSCLNGVNLLLGVGVLSLPYAFSVSGWWVGAGLLIVLSLLTNYTGKLIGRLMSTSDQIRSFPDIGRAAFGRVGMVMISIIFFIELFAACGMYLILCGDNLYALISPFYTGLSQTSLTLISAAIMVPTALTSELSLLSKLSAIGTFSSCLLAIAVVSIGVLNGPRNEGTFLHPAHTVMYTDMERAPLAIGLVMVGFAGHACFPSIRCSMDQPKQYNAMLDVSYMVCFTIYGSVAALGYLMYGTSTLKEITLNITSDTGASDLVQMIARIATFFIVINPITKFGLTMNPVALMVEEVVMEWINKDRSNEDIDAQEKSCKNTLVSMSIRILLSIAVTATAVSLPFFARVVGFIGAFCSCFVSIVFPVAAALVLLKNEMSRLQRVFAWCVLIFGLVCTIWGTVAVFVSPV